MRHLALLGLLLPGCTFLARVGATRPAGDRSPAACRALRSTATADALGFGTAALLAVAGGSFDVSDCEEGGCPFLHDAPNKVVFFSGLAVSALYLASSTYGFRQRSGCPAEPAPRRPVTGPTPFASSTGPE